MCESKSIKHHEWSGEHSENAIIINNQTSNDYSNKCLSGVGVVYKFLQFCDANFGIDGADKYLDLVSLGMTSDMMSMQTPENRFICDYGLSNINNELFIEILKKQVYSLFGSTIWTDEYLSNGELTQIKVAFYVTPLINALIRVGTFSEKELLFKGFIEGDSQIESTKRGEKGIMETVAEQSARNCTNARARQNREKEKAMELIDIQIMNDCLDENKILILDGDDLEISNTLTGLIAMGVAAKYKKPVLLGRTSSDGFFKGSGRGRDGSELKDFRQFLLDSGLMKYCEG